MEGTKESGNVEEIMIDIEVEVETSGKAGNGTAAWRGRERTGGITR
jgi:hypothetical protein